VGNNIIYLKTFSFEIWFITLQKELEVNLNLIFSNLKNSSLGRTVIAVCFKTERMQLIVVYRWSIYCISNISYIIGNRWKSSNNEKNDMLSAINEEFTKIC
jgi:stalled ribosome rescue protein Dom34